MKLESGDILICTSNRPIPTLIKWATKSKWTHTSQYFKVDNVDYIIEAQMDGIHLKLFKDWEEKYKYEYIVYRRKSFGKDPKMAEMELERIKNRAFSKIWATGYDFVSFCLRQPLKLITGKFKYRGEEREVERMICSEYTAWIYELRGWWKMTPDDVEKYLEKSNRFIKI